MLSVGGVAGAGWKLTISGRGVVSAAGWGDGPIRRSGRRRTSTKSVPGTPGFRPGTSALVPVLDAGTEESEIQLAKDDTVACTEPASLDVGSGGVYTAHRDLLSGPPGPKPLSVHGCRRLSRGAHPDPPYRTTIVCARATRFTFLMHGRTTSHRTSPRRGHRRRENTTTPSVTARPWRPASPSERHPQHQARLAQRGAAEWSAVRGHAPPHALPAAASVLVTTRRLATLHTRTQSICHFSLGRR